MDNISFSKIVATPTLNSWSQAYNAGKLFAVLSLERTQEATQDLESLNMLGKNLLERLEQEFFAIEDKNLESIKKAILTIFEKEITGVNISFAAGTFVGNILYLFGLGDAKVFIKRGGNLGLALNSEDITITDIAASSGFLKEKDLIVLTTDAFSQVVTQEDLNLSLNDTDPLEIAESLAPRIHKAENGKISAIIIKYATPQVAEVIDEGEDAEPEEIIQEEGLSPEGDKKQNPISPFTKYFSLAKSLLKKPNLKIVLTKKIFLVSAVAIIFVLILSVFLNIQSQNNAKVKALFAQIYPQALKKYNDGQGLTDLNKNLARGYFTSAQKILNENKAKFPEKSKESAQVQDLLKKIDTGLAEVSPVDKSGLNRSKLSIAVVNGSGIEGTAGKAATILKDLGYNVVSTGNADNFDYAGVTIKVKKEMSNFLDLLKKDLSKEYTVSATSSDLSPDSSTDALIIIGK